MGTNGFQLWTSFWKSRSPGLPSTVRQSRSAAISRLRRSRSRGSAMRVLPDFSIESSSLAAHACPFQFAGGQSTYRPPHGRGRILPRWHFQQDRGSGSGGRHLITDFLAKSISRIPGGSCDHDHKDVFAKETLQRIQSDPCNLGTRMIPRLDSRQSAGNVRRAGAFAPPHFSELKIRALHPICITPM